MQHLVAEGLLTDYCYFAIIKSKFKNSLYYNYTYTKLKQINGFSRNLLQRKIEKYLRNGWCTIVNNHLKFESVAVICQRESIKAVVYQNCEIATDNVKDLKLSLQRMLFEDNLRKQEYVMKRRNDLTNPNTLADLKRAKRFFRKNEIGESSATLITSNVTLARLFQCSLSAAARIKKLFLLREWYAFQRNFTVLGTGISQYAFSKGIAPYIQKGVFYFNGAVYKSLPSTVIRLND